MQLFSGDTAKYLKFFEIIFCPWKHEKKKALEFFAPNQHESHILFHENYRIPTLQMYKVIL